MSHGFGDTTINGMHETRTQWTLGYVPHRRRDDRKFPWPKILISSASGLAATGVLIWLARVITAAAT